MHGPDRRRFLGLLGAGAATALAGCGGDEDPAPGLHAVRTVVVHRPGYADMDYPEDVAVRVDVENTSRHRKEGTLVVTLTRERTGGGGTPGGGGERWERRTDFSLQSVTTRSFIVVFESVLDEEGDASDLAASARVETGGGTPG